MDISMSWGRHVGALDDFSAVFPHLGDGVIYANLGS